MVVTNRPTTSAITQAATTPTGAAVMAALPYERSEGIRTALGLDSHGMAAFLGISTKT